MSARLPVLVSAASETLALRLRLLVEAEGAQLAGPDEKPVLVLGDAPAPEHAGIPRITVKDGDWQAALPALRQALDSCRGGTSLAAVLAGRRILVVDDSVTYREYLRQELGRWGVVVAVCASADEALPALAAGAWDGVLLDMVMPKVDGIDLCRRIDSIRRERGMGFLLLVMSSREGKADLLRALEAGADAFFGKSQDMELLRARLGAFLRYKSLRG